MKRISLATADTLRRMLFQRKRVTLFHVLAFLAVAFAYLAYHVEAVPFGSCRRGCGTLGLLRSLVAWWPVAASWWWVKDPMESSASFRWWQVLFTLINVVAVYGYALTDTSTMLLTYAAFWSLLHLESTSSEQRGKSPNKSLERTRER